MKKYLTFAVASFVVLLFAAQTASAQLIDYNRRNRAQAQNPPAAPKKTTTMAESQTQAKQGMAEVYNVKTGFEKKYDLNRDGKLKGSEVQAMLADTVKEVEAAGRAEVISPVLKPYDVNGDGYISRYEVAAITDVLGR